MVISRNYEFITSTEEILVSRNFGVITQNLAKRKKLVNLKVLINSCHGETIEKCERGLS